MKAFVPELADIEPLTVLRVDSLGDPNHSQKYLKALYGTAYGTKMKVFKPQAKTLKLGPLIGRWPDAYNTPKDQWTGHWGLVVSGNIVDDDLLQKDPSVPVWVERWEYGKVAQILHEGSYADETPTIEKLQRFVADQGYGFDITTHEEVYLTTPQAKLPRTIIRYSIQKLNQKG